MHSNDNFSSDISQENMYILMITSYWYFPGKRVHSNDNFPTDFFN